MTTPRVRLATPADADGAAALFVEGQGGTHQEHREGFLREMGAARPNNLVLVAEEGGEVVGFGRARYVEPPADAPADAAPAGWYLLGVRVAAAHRRRGIGAALTQARLEWIARRADAAFYFTGAGNHASAALHARFGFVEVSRAFTFAGASNADVLYRAELSKGSHSPP
jgi:ribosomal protein S18 acetylase RimI-like enzyme